MAAAAGTADRAAGVVAAAAGVDTGVAGVAAAAGTADGAAGVVAAAAGTADGAAWVCGDPLVVAGVWASATEANKTHNHLIDTHIGRSGGELYSVFTSLISVRGRIAFSSC